jgi:ubiquinone/menaquinone biosynthesis C-methylase UbiE
MAGYESVIEERKTELFTRAFSNRTGKVDVVELGAGTWPNAKYYDMVASTTNFGVSVDVYGVDPNEYMTPYALGNFEKVKSDKVKYDPLRGVSENLPFEDGSVDVAVVSLVLCSVEDQLASLKEVKRVLKPKTGKFIFVEHVLSQTNDSLRRQQEALTPMQIKAADGCRLNRKTGEVIKKVFGSENVDYEYFDLDGFWVIGSQIAGIASV